MRALLALAAASSALACATPYAKLDGVLSGVRPAPPREPAPVTLVHQGRRLPGEVQQSVVKGDDLLTAADGVALLTLRAGYEVIVEPGTELSIENPSIFVRVGKLFLKTIRRTSEALRLNTKFVSAGVEGTQFIFEVTRDDVVRLSVLEGSVFVSSRSSGWDRVVYHAGQVVTIRAETPPSPVQPLDPATTRATYARAEIIERAARYRTGAPWSRFTPLWKKPVFFVPAGLIAAGTVVFFVTRGNDSQGTVTINIPF
jgi:ferric-dicitrate binding protein FerR (iron transport regulator)